MTTFKLKIVPDTEPNANGQWVEQSLDAQQIKNFPEHDFGRQAEFLSQFIPAGFHIVAISKEELPAGLVQASEGLPCASKAALTEALVSHVGRPAERRVADLTKLSTVALLLKQKMS